MKIRLLTLMAGPDGSAQPGAVLDVSEAEAKALVSGGYAEPMEKPAEARAPKEGKTDAVQRDGAAGRGARNSKRSPGKAASAPRKQ